MFDICISKFKTTQFDNNINFSPKLDKNENNINSKHREYIPQVTCSMCGHQEMIVWYGLP